MILIAVSGSQRTDWAIIKGDQAVDRAVTAGLNPYLHSRREISHYIRLQLPEHFFRNRYDMVYFYGAGCSMEDKAKIVESSLISQLRSRTQVNTDLLGAARSMLQNDAGIVCILATGSNSCFYDGNNIVNNVIAGGFILGDEGSNTYMGKMLASDVLKKLAPLDVIEAFYRETQTTPESVLDQVYDCTNATKVLSRYRDVLLNNINKPYCWTLVRNAFDAFFTRNISAYDFHTYPLYAMGSACYDFKQVFLESANKFGVKVKDIVPSCIEGLIRYHIINR